MKERVQYMRRLHQVGKATAEELDDVLPPLKPFCGLIILHCDKVRTHTHMFSLAKSSHAKYITSLDW